MSFLKSSTLTSVSPESNKDLLEIHIKSGFNQAVLAHSQICLFYSKCYYSRYCYYSC